MGNTPQFMADSAMFALALPTFALSVCGVCAIWPSLAYHFALRPGNASAPGHFNRASCVRWLD
jgi:hypothetical protein